ncbi:MAG: AI-2E family transporter [Coprobacillaceae bacterium]
MKQKKQVLITFAYYALISLLVLLATYIAFTWLLPVVISLLVVMALQPLIATIVKKLHVENKYALVFVSILVYLVIIGGVLYLCFLGMIQLYLFIEKLPNYIDEVFTFVTNSDVFMYLDGYAVYFHDSINEIVQNFSTSFIDYLINFISKIPSLAFDVMFIVISSLFFILDYKNIKQFILKHCHNEENVRNVIGCVKETISSVFKAYLSIFVMTFIELLVGFYIIGLNDALTLSFSIALFDFLPVLGLDMIFIPWIIILAFQNQMSLALALLVIYLIVTISKNIFEPRLISKHIGMHPLLTIVSMFIGLKFLGILGMVIVPLLIMIGLRLYELNREVKHE